MYGVWEISQNRRGRRGRGRPRPRPRLRPPGQRRQLEALCRGREFRVWCGGGAIQGLGFFIRRWRLPQLVEPLVTQVPLVLRLRVGHDGRGRFGVDVPGGLVGTAGLLRRERRLGGGGEVRSVGFAGAAAEDEDEGDGAEAEDGGYDEGGEQRVAELRAGDGVLGRRCRAGGGAVVGVRGVGR